MNSRDNLEMSHITKFIIRILLNRTRSRIWPKIEENCGIVQDAKTRNVIFLVRILSQRAIKIPKGIYLSFIDYTKFMKSYSEY